MLDYKEHSSGNGNILLVEDEPIMQELLMTYISQAGFTVTAVADGNSAWQILCDSHNQFDSVLLDRQLPDINGMEILRRIKQHPHFASLPVILETASDWDEAILEGLQAGAYYYLAKPIQEAKLIEVLQTAVGDYRRYRALQNEVQQFGNPCQMLQEARFTFKSLLSAKRLAVTLADLCPNPEKAILGLSELLSNAVEHGNLEIDYQTKSDLIENDSLIDEIYERLDDPHYSDREVEVSLRKTPTAIEFTITDQGPGFDWTPYLSLSLERIYDKHGRGIALANEICFDSLEYQGCGNRVVCRLNWPEETDEDSQYED